MHQRASDATYREILDRLRAYAAMHQTCPAAAVGAAVVVDGQIIITGVNGAPAGIVACQDAGCDWTMAGQAGTGRDHARHLHAEAMAICLAAGTGRRIAGADIVVTQPPCPTCALLIMASGLARVVIDGATMPWGWAAIREALAAGGVSVVVLE